MTTMDDVFRAIQGCVIPEAGDEFRVVVMHPLTHNEILRQTEMLVINRPSLGERPPATMFGLPVKVDVDEPEDGPPRVELRMTPAQFWNVVEREKSAHLFRILPPPAPAPTMRAVVNKWIKRWKR